MTRIYLYSFFFAFTSTLVYASSVPHNNFDSYYDTYFDLRKNSNEQATAYMDSLSVEAKRLDSDYYYSKFYYALFYDVGRMNDSAAYFIEKSAALISNYEDSVFFMESNYMAGRLAVFEDDFFRGVVGINKALKSISERFDIYYKQIGDKVYLTQSKCLATLGVVYERLEDYELGLNYFMKALKTISILDTEEAKRFRISLIGNIGYAHCNLKNYEKAAYYIERAIALKKKEEGSNKEFEYRIMASIEYGKGNYDLALKNLDKSDVELGLTPKTVEYDMNTFWRGKIYLAKGEYGLAINKLLSIVESFQENFTGNDLADLYELLGEAYDQYGEKDKSLSYYKEALKNRALNANSNDRKGFDEFLAFYDQEQEETMDRIGVIKDQEKQQRSKIEIESERQKKNWIYSLFSIIVCLLITGIVSITLANRKSKRTNVELVDLVDEKNVLFKEVHHRVKNNFQIISSLLNLQQDTVHEKESSAALEEAQRRIRSMSLVHEMLYERDNIKEIDFKKYAFELTRSVLESISGTEKIDFEVVGDGFVLDLDKAIPLGLILNEATTNAAKHAFNDIANPKITIYLNTDENNECVVSVEDNGIGISEEAQQYNEGSLGIELINILTEQINGALKMICENGTKVRISFRSV